ncbi:MAG: hypothetical protein IPK71_11755 [Myxococcales bacterium]|nr:hypothetical protein [Myxococcales bacterium]
MRLSDIPICKVAGAPTGKAVPSQRPLELASAPLWASAHPARCAPCPPRCLAKGGPKEPYGYRKTMKRLDAALGPRLKSP